MEALNIYREKGTEWLIHLYENRQQCNAATTNSLYAPMHAHALL